MSQPNEIARLVVLDRDGVINQDSREFIKSADEWLPIAGSVEAIADLSRAGFRVVVATNQSGLARGLFDEATLSQIHQKLHDSVTTAGGRVEHIFICPHGPDGDCDCRKPKPGLLRQIADHFDIDLTGIPVIGDSLRDIEPAAAVGARPILVRTGNGRVAEEQRPPKLACIEVYDNLAAAVAALLSE